MTHSRLPLAATVAAAAMIAALPGDAAASALQSDIETCGAAAADAGLIDEERAVLRFVSDRGRRTRTLTVKALRDADEPVVIDCRMKRRAVIEVRERADA